MTDFWTQWEGRVINGEYPLRRFLGMSDHSVVFLSDCLRRDIVDAALKFVPTDPRSSDADLAEWRLAMSLPHPHLLRLFDAGSCELGGQSFLFIVMELAEQSLTQILPRRALTPDELREMLIPTVDALGFLHGKRAVHGGVKPSNVLVVDDRVKLASDTIRMAGSFAAGRSSSAANDPSARDGVVSAAGDIWALGVTMVEALTQAPPQWGTGPPGTLCLPADFPAAFVDPVRRCLAADPTARPSTADLQAWLGTAPAAPAAPASPPKPAVAEPVSAAVTPPAPPAPPPRAVAQPPKPAVVAPVPVAVPTPQHAADSQPTSPRPSPVFAVVGILVVTGVLWMGLRLYGSRPASPATAPLPQASSPTPSNDALSVATIPAMPVAPPPLPSRPAAPLPIRSTAAAGDTAVVLHEEDPDVLPRALASIHGHFTVTIKATIDRDGNVAQAELQGAGPSPYFARMARNAALKWKFARSEENGGRARLIRFEFSRNAATGHAVLAGSGGR